MKEEIRFVRHEDKVCMLVNGQLTADMPWQAAMQAGAALISLAKQIENDQNPQQQIIDQAILMRAGVKLGLSDNGLIIKEAHKEAQYDRDLRRHMRNAPGIGSREIVGTPTLTRGLPNARRH